MTITLDYSNVMDFIKEEELQKTGEKVLEASLRLQDKTCKGAACKGAACKGAGFLGWLNYPENTDKNLTDDIADTAKDIRKKYEVLICIGIGGSYLGAKAAIEALKYNHGKGAEVIFLGQNLSSDYIYEVLNSIQDKEVAVNVISKSGTTLEPAVSFRIIKEYLEKKYGRAAAQKRIIATTDKAKGALKELANKENYKTFVIDDDIGGRFSVLTPVGLLPIAAAGRDIYKILEGAKDIMRASEKKPFDQNSVYVYAALRNILYKKGRQIEILSSFVPNLIYFAEWWKQLFGESEGKDCRGIFPASCNFTTDLHSMGQYIQDGLRVLFETFLLVEKSAREVTVPKDALDLDKLNYIAGKSLDYINFQAFKGTALAHKEGGVPNLTISIPYLDEYILGQLFYFFEKTIAISGLLLDINPFDQPGVEAYKKNMFALMNKPGTENELKVINEKLGNIKKYAI